MNERHFINNILIKYFVAKRHSKCIYRRRDDPDGGLLRLYRCAKWYKELKTVGSHSRSNDRLYIAYTSDKEVKVSHVKQRIIKQKVMKNFQMVFYSCFCLLVVLSCIACLLLYNNHNHVECVLPYGDCPVIQHREVETFLVNVKVHEMAKERILEVCSAMKGVQREVRTKPEGERNDSLGGRAGRAGRAGLQMMKMMKAKKRRYSLLNTDRVKCRECQVVFQLEGKETLQDIFLFEEVNKCQKSIGREHCVHVREGAVRNRRIHLYKRYRGPIRSSDERQKGAAREKGTSREKGAAREKVVLDDKVKFLHPSLKDYVLNLDYFTLRSESGQRIPVNEEPLRGGTTPREESRHICRPDYREAFGEETFYWLCPQFYEGEEERGSREHNIAASIMQMVNMQGAGEADANKHLLEMSKSSATTRRYDHFGFVEGKLELPFRVDIYSRFQPQDGETEQVDVLEKIYRAFFCSHAKEHHHTKEHPHAYAHSAASHQDDMPRMAFFFPGQEGERKEEAPGTLQGVDRRDTNNNLGKDNTSVHREGTSISDEGENLSLEDLCREDHYEEADHCEEADHYDEANHARGAKGKAAGKGEGHTRRVLIKEVPTVRREKQKEEHPKGLEKELVVISPSLFFGMMRNLLCIVIFFLLLLLGMMCVMVAMYICLAMGYDVSVILRDQGEMEEMPRYLKRLSRHLTGGGGCVSVGGTDGGYFGIHRHASDPF
ncbi:hypothetical protein PVNG_04315 [Plasmodium vivax North Korean]|uniref:Uncharacterized protein n=1 Tax=Plasmodium vivax North Korean TaxID=1035514 RepID=A0A0J9TX64_PLAVI|nr:hypothetical protein PVNG_04315 [Plasmodium vivax North Korean]